MAIEQSKGNPCSYKQAWRTLGATRAEAVGCETKRVDRGSTRMIVTYAREHHGIPRLQDDRGEGLEPFTNRLLPTRDPVIFAMDSDEDK